MSEQPTTPFSNRCQILADLWMLYREDEAFSELMKYGDLGFPLAFAIFENVVEATPLSEEYINELWELLLGELGVEDTGEFELLSQVLDSSPYPKE